MDLDLLDKIKKLFPNMKTPFDMEEEMQETKDDSKTNEHKVNVSAGNKPKDSCHDIKYGHFCIKCRDYNEYAESNLDNNKFICFACRS